MPVIVIIGGDFGGSNIIIVLYMKDIAVFGAGGFGKEVACLIKKINECGDGFVWNFIGFFDDNVELHGMQNGYGRIIGGIDALNNYPNPLSLAVAIGSPTALKAVVEKIKNPLVDFPNLIAPSTIFLDSDSVVMGKGNIICSNCLISLHATIGNFNIFNGYIPIGHDTVIDSYNVVMPSCNISGGVTIGDCNFLGVQSVVLQNVKIGNNTRVGANSVIIRKTKDGYLYIGNPAKRVAL